MYRKTFAEIDKKILEENVREIVGKYPYEYVFGVVKNDAYGHGIEIIDALIRGGVNYLAVSSLDEAMEIREKNKEIPVLVLEPVSLEFRDVILDNQITLTVQSLDYAKDLVKFDFKKKLKVHMKIDSGMNRLGFKVKEELDEAVKILRENKKIEVEGVFTHFATSGRGDIFYDKQLKIAQEMIKDIGEVPIVHFDRSLTLVSHEKIGVTNGMRLGIIMYGFSGSRPRPTGLRSKLRILKHKLQGQKEVEYIAENDLKLKTAFKLYSEVIAVRKVEALEYVGYNARYKMKEKGYVATISIGYADGVNKDFREVVINDKRYPIISDSMDMLMVLVDEKVKAHDKVEIFGDKIKVWEVATRLGTNAYHVFSRITKRVPRIYK